MDESTAKTNTPQRKALSRISTRSIISCVNVNPFTYLGTVLFKPAKFWFRTENPLNIQMNFSSPLYNKYTTYFKQDVALKSLTDSAYLSKLDEILIANNLYMNNLQYDAEEHVAKGLIYYDSNNPTFLSALTKK